jgi:hypothetical protein
MAAAGFSWSQRREPLRHHLGEPKGVRGGLRRPSEAPSLRSSFYGLAAHAAVHDRTGSPGNICELNTLRHLLVEPGSAAERPPGSVEIRQCL